MFRKTLMGTVFAVSVMAAAAFPAKAAETIDGITMEINSDFYIGGGADTDYVSVLVDNTECRVESISVTNKPKDDEWEEGDRPKIKVIVRAESGYTFASGMGKGDVELGSEDAVITSVTRSGPRLTVSITLPKLDENDYNADMDYNLNASGLSWDQGNGMACWEEAAFAKKYEVRLFRGSSNVTGILTTTECSLDLAPYFTKSGNYIFKVRGVRSTTKKGEWQESDGFYVDAEKAAEIKAAGTQNAGKATFTSADPAGRWIEQPEIGWWWSNPDGSYPRLVWAFINGRWFYFDDRGYCLMNRWVSTSGKWYYCGPDGGMLIDQVIDGKYYVNTNGEWVQ